MAHEALFHSAALHHYDKNDFGIYRGHGNDRPQKITQLNATSRKSQCLVLLTKS